MIGLYFAVTFVFSLTVILSPTFLSSPLTTQPANSLFSGAVKPSLFGKVYSLPLATDTLSLFPLPSPLSKLTSTMIGFQDAFITVSLVIVISVPGSVVVVVSPTNHPANFLFSGGVKVSPFGKVYFSPDFLYSTLLSPVPPFA